MITAEKSRSLAEKSWEKQRRLKRSRCTKCGTPYTKENNLLDFQGEVVCGTCLVATWVPAKADHPMKSCMGWLSDM